MRRPFVASAVALALVLAGVAFVSCAPAASSDDLARAGATRTTSSGSPLDGIGYVPVNAPSSTLRPRPDDAPDLVIIAFSGHCGLICDTRSTWSYLSNASESTGGVAVLDAIARAYARLGLAKVEVFSASSFATSHYSSISGKIEPGYLQAQAYLDEVKRDWIDGVADPTRV
ncbi:MAG TPA: hypothetical protein PKN52_04515, partial [Trueperaceae bacterium]|nr:hypothetical protein [Trueperaceae bacterium]